MPRVKATSLYDVVRRLDDAGLFRLDETSRAGNRPERKRFATAPAGLQALVSVHLARFAIILIALAVAPMLGISGWYVGLAANVACLIFAAALVTVRGLWRSSGVLVAWRGPRAVILLIPLVIEVLAWAVPAGLVEQPPGFGLWSITLLLAAANEELTGRVVVLERMRPAFRPHIAVAITAALFGLQHLSAFATRAVHPTTSSSMCSSRPAMASRSQHFRCVSAGCGP